MSVDRCVCHDVSFTFLKELSRREGLDFAGLRRRTGCGSGCGLCEPYIRLMLSTGGVAVPVLSAEEVARIMADPRAPQRPGEGKDRHLG